LRSSANSVGAVIWPLVGGALGTLSWQAPFGVYLDRPPARPAGGRDDSRDRRQ